MSYGRLTDNWEDDANSFRAPLIPSNPRRDRHIVDHVRAGGGFFDRATPEPFRPDISTPEPTTELGLYVRDHLRKKGCRV